jgi:hypothetical protein
MRESIGSPSERRASSIGEIKMSHLPKIGEVVQLFGIGCEGCGHFRGEFEVRAIIDGDALSIIVDPRDIQCEGPVERDTFVHLTLSWNRDLECWQANCGDHEVVVHISGHYAGPTRQAA